jgi:hypothetical protein
MKTLVRLNGIALALVLAFSGLHGAIAVRGTGSMFSTRNDIGQQPDLKRKELSASARLENEALTLTAYFPNDDQPIKLGLYNILGKLIEIHPSTSATKGEQTFHFTTKGLPSGPYIVVLESNGQRVVNKVMLAR